MKKILSFVFCLFCLRAEAGNLTLISVPLENYQPEKTKNLSVAIKNNLAQRRIQTSIAQPVSETLSGSINRAMDDQFNFSDEKAAQTLQNAIQTLKPEQMTLKDLSSLAQAHLLLASSYKNLGKMQEMNAAMIEAARLNPTLNLSQMQFSPSLIGYFEKAKDKVWKEGAMGQVTMNTLPEKGKIFINGFFKGVAPLRLEHYPTGNHYVTAVWGKENSTKKIRIGTGLTSLTFKPSTSSDKKKILTLKNFRSQKEWLAELTPHHESSLGISVVSDWKKNEMSVLFHPINWNKEKAEVVVFKETKAWNKVAAELFK